MKPEKIKKLKKQIAVVLTGEAAPARVYTIKPDGKGGFTRTAIDPKEYQSRQAAAVQATNEAAAARAKLNLSQSQFSKLLGVSIDTLQNWEQGRRKPRGAALVLLRVAMSNPEAVLKAA